VRSSKREQQDHPFLLLVAIPKPPIHPNTGPVWKRAGRFLRKEKDMLLRAINTLTRIAASWIKKHTDEGKRISELCPFVKNCGCAMDKPDLKFLRKKCPQMCEKFKEER
jgi:hypothetical protein